MDVQDELNLHGGFLQCLSRSARAQLMTLAHPVHFEPGEVIFRQNAPSRYLYIIKEGRVAIELYLPPRGVCRILTLGPGELFSWSAVIEPCTETAMARAIESTSVFAINGSALIRLCLKDCVLASEVYRVLATLISMRLRATQFQLLDVFAAD